MSFAYMKFKRVKTSKTGKNTPTRYLVWTQKKKKYANKSKEKYISKKKSIIIEGMHSSGKSREILKIHRRSAEVWSGKTIILLRYSDSLADWLTKNLNEDDEKNLIDANKDDAEMLAANIKRQHVKLAQLVHKCNGAILLVDDIDKAAGKKKEIIKDLVRVSALTIATASDYKEIDNTVERQLKNKGLEVLKMSTDSSYDGTYILFAVFILGLFSLGMPELAMLVMAGRYAAKGIQK